MDETITSLYTRPGPFATVLVDVSLDSEAGGHAVEVAAGDVAATLREQGAPEEVAEQVRATVAEPVHEPAPRSRFVVASAEGVLLDEVLPAETPSPVVSWDVLPELAPLLSHRAASVPFLLVEVDHRGGEVTPYESQGFEPGESASAGGDDTRIHKVPTGGWSALRYQHRSEKTWRDNAREVAELAVSQVAAGHRLVIVAGSVESRPEIVEALTDGPADVVELERSARNLDGGEEALTDDLQDVVLDRLRRRREELTAELQERLGQGTRVAAGLDAVLDAFVLGQVQTVVLDLERTRELTVTPAEHEGLDLGPETPDRPVRADLALLAAAARTDADVSFGGPDELGEHPVVAVLRWDDTDRPTET